MAAKAKIFLVDDNPDLRDSLTEYLSLSDYEVVAFGAAEGVLEAYRLQRPDLLILDVMLPGGDGFSLAKELRSHSRVPLIFLTARESESDRITGFELGADDYVVKPFSLKEFVLRVNALLRRVQDSPQESDLPAVWWLGDEILSVEEAAHRVSVSGRQIGLTPKEWRVLLYFLERPGTVAGREEILAGCLNSGEEAGDRTVDTYIKNIRSKLGSSGWIQTVRGFGYRFTGIRVSGGQF